MGYTLHCFLEDHLGEIFLLNKQNVLTKTPKYQYGRKGAKATAKNLFAPQGDADKSKMSKEVSTRLCCLALTVTTTPTQF